MYSQIIGGVLSLGTGIGSGLIADHAWQAAKGKANDRLDDIRRRRLETIQHRDNLYYQDPTQTAENQVAVNQAQQLLDEQTKRSNAGKTVTGATDESVALQKAANAAVVGNMIQQQAVEGANKKERIWNNAEAQLNALENEYDMWQRYKADTQKAQFLSKAQNFSDTGQSVARTIASMPF